MKMHACTRSSLFFPFSIFQHRVFLPRRMSCFQIVAGMSPPLPEFSFQLQTSFVSAS